LVQAVLVARQRVRMDNQRLINTQSGLLTDKIQYSELLLRSVVAPVEVHIMLILLVQQVLLVDLVVVRPVIVIREQGPGGLELQDKDLEVEMVEGNIIRVEVEAQVVKEQILPRRQMVVSVIIAIFWDQDIFGVEVAEAPVILFVVETVELEEAAVVRSVQLPVEAVIITAPLVEVGQLLPQQTDLAVTVEKVQEVEAAEAHIITAIIKVEMEVAE